MCTEPNLIQIRQIVPEKLVFIDKRHRHKERLLKNKPFPGKTFHRHFYLILKEGIRLSRMADILAHPV